MNATATHPSERGARAALAEASVWIVRLHSQERSPELEAGFREWLNADPQNARQFEHITDVWDLGGAVTADGLPRMRTWGASPAPRRWLLATPALLIFAIGAFAGYRYWGEPSYSTAHGEQRLVRLEDGTRITLNTATDIRVQYDDNTRHIDLIQGEALFEVAKETRRPFLVTAQDRRIEALGTSFLVREDRERLIVTLIEGKVAIASADVSDRQRGEEILPRRQIPHTDVTAAVATALKDEVLLSPGERLTLARSAPPKLDSPRLEAITAWRRGEVLLEATPLSEAVAEMNRYDKPQLVIDDPALASVRISGIYRTGDSEGFASAVAELHGLKVVKAAHKIHLRAMSP